MKKIIEVKILVFERRRKNDLIYAENVMPLTCVTYRNIHLSYQPELGLQ